MINYLWGCLPDVFTMKEAICITQDKIPPYMTEKLIRGNTELFQRVRRGVYKKKGVDFLTFLSKIYEG